jgi:ABC-type glutathione transport system ATPase component
VIVSHDVVAVARVADTVTVLDRGQVVWSGPVTEAPPGYLG